MKSNFSARYNRTKFQNKLVAEKDLEDYLNNGWEMVQTVNGKILVRKKA